MKHVKLFEEFLNEAYNLDEGLDFTFLSLDAEMDEVKNDVNALKKHGFLKWIGARDAGDIYLVGSSDYYDDETDTDGSNLFKAKGKEKSIPELEIHAGFSAARVTQGFYMGEKAIAINDGSQEFYWVGPKSAKKFDKVRDDEFLDEAVDGDTNESREDLKGGNKLPISDGYLKKLKTKFKGDTKKIAKFLGYDKDIVQLNLDKLNESYNSDEAFTFADAVDTAGEDPKTEEKGISPALKFLKAKSANDIAIVAETPDGDDDLYKAVKKMKPMPIDSYVYDEAFTGMYKGTPTVVFKSGNDLFAYQSK